MLLAILFTIRGEKLDFSSFLHFHWECIPLSRPLTLQVTRGPVNPKHFLQLVAGLERTFIYTEIVDAADAAAWLGV